MQLLIRKARVTDPQSDFHNEVVDLYIENGIIKDISPDIQVKIPTVIAANGLHVSPGWVDVFADYCEPGHEQKETIATGLTAAAAGGFTEVLLAPNTSPVLSTKSILEYVSGRAKGNIVTLYPMGAATQEAKGQDLAEMIDMRHSHAIAFTDGWKPVQNAALTLKALEYVKTFNGIFVQIPNDTSLSSGGLMHEGVVSTMLGMPGIPVIAETMMLHRDIELLRYTGSRLHVTGISSAEAVLMIQKAKAEGLHITCSVTPYHLALTDDALKTYNSIYKVTPPLRSETDRLALIEGLRNGTIDCIATHHHPQEWDAKAKEFEYASGGMAVQENAFSILWDAVRHSISIDRLVEAMTIIPRDIFGMDQPAISAGTKAALTMFTTAEKHILHSEQVRSKSRNNPFIGKELHGKVLGIINNNQLLLNK